ncbi:hypothetical protein MRB53_032305 [Persea americana]|uniref:Uncharacterized protein n=1 Tax=Persea americana TaxID=3435 RepID=A0ACC2KRH2_PERAE|nr:hypothetical protein MRB53_032305 [Persea americana]
MKWNLLTPLCRIYDTVHKHSVSGKLLLDADVYDAARTTMQRVRTGGKLEISPFRPTKSFESLDFSESSTFEVLLRSNRGFSSFESKKTGGLAKALELRSAFQSSELFVSWIDMKKIFESTVKS